MASSARDLSTKIKIVEEIKVLLDHCPTVIVVRYNKVNANQMNELRGDLEKANGMIKIYKNSLMSLASKEKYPLLSKNLVLNNAFVFTAKDAFNCLKVLKKFQDENKGFEFVKGVFNHEEKLKEELEELAQLPNREGLLSMLLSSLEGKLKTLLWGLKEVAKTKEIN